MLQSIARESGQRQRHGWCPPVRESARGQHSTWFHRVARPVRMPRSLPLPSGMTYSHSLPRIQLYGHNHTVQGIWAGLFSRCHDDLLASEINRGLTAGSMVAFRALPRCVRPLRPGSPRHQRAVRAHPADSERDLFLQPRAARPTRDREEAHAALRQAAIQRRRRRWSMTMCARELRMRDVRWRSERGASAVAQRIAQWCGVLDQWRPLRMSEKID